MENDWPANGLVKNYSKMGEEEILGLLNDKDSFEHFIWFAYLSLTSKNEAFNPSEKVHQLTASSLLLLKRLNEMFQEDMKGEK